MQPFTGDSDGGYVELRFDTAWCPPKPIIDKVFEMFPALEISWNWSNEDDGYALTYSIERDPVTSDDDEEAAA